MPGAIFQPLFSGGGPPIGTPVLIAHAEGDPGASSTVTTTTSATSTANALIVVGFSRARGATFNITSVTDGTANVYSHAIGGWSATDSWGHDLWYCPNALSVPSGNTISVVTNATDGGFPASIVAAYVTGVQITSPIDQTVLNIQATTTVPTSGNTSTLAKNNEIAFGWMSGYIGGSGETMTEASGWTRLFADATANNTANWLLIDFAYKILSSNTALAYNPTLGANATFTNTTIATFKGN